LAGRPVLNMNTLFQRTNERYNPAIEYDFTTRVVDLATASEIDAFVFSSMHGYADLDDGAMVPFLASDLGISIERIHYHADWNRFKNESATLIALHAHRSRSVLRGTILAPDESSKFYPQFESLAGGVREFFYDVSYVSIAHLSRTLNARKIGLTHLCGPDDCYQDIATSALEALAHFCNAEHARNLDRFAFVGGSKLTHLRVAAERLERGGTHTMHRPLAVRTEEIEPGVSYIHISWPGR